MNRVIAPELVEKWPLEKHIGVTSKLLVDGQNMTVLWSRWEPNAAAPVHSHVHEQIGFCMEGQITIKIDDEEEYIAKSGEFYHIPSNVPHAESNNGSVSAVLVDFFSPTRIDLLNKHFMPDS